MYALLNTSDDSLVKIRNREFAQGVPNVSHKGWYWVPAEQKDKPDFDPATHKLEATEGLVNGIYTFDWSVVEKTQEEKDEHERGEDTSFLAARMVEHAKITVRLIDALLAKGTIAASDFPADVRQDYMDFKSRVDRL